MRRWILGIALVVVTLGGVGAAHADYDDGQRAWDAGRHSEALREWQASANAGDAKAMLALGRLYMQGLGAPQNYVKAHLWFNLAASRGEAEAVKERDALAARMSAEKVAEAQDLAAAWQPGESQPAAFTTRKPAGPPPPKAIREAQELLAVLGYEPDPPDGQWGERTAQAYQAFIRDANLPVTDTFTPAALKAMRAKARQAGAVSTSKPKATLLPDALHRAAKAGNLKGLEAALATGMDVNARDDKGWTALMYVVDKGYVLLVEPLVQAKADPDVRAPDGATALFMAAAHGHGEIIPMLMEAGADPTIKGPKGKTATEVAQSRYGDPMKALENGESPAVVALMTGKPWTDGEKSAEILQGSVFRDCEQCPEMVVVPPGRFRMGDLSGDGPENERPVRDVIIDYPLAVGRYEVTRGEFALFVEATGYETDNSCIIVTIVKGKVRRQEEGGWRRPGFMQTARHPVVCVSLDDSQAYVRWLSRKTGKAYRLLSEAEWEYVARAGSTTAYPWGDDVGSNKADCFFLCGDGLSLGKVATIPVGDFEPNDFGLFDTVSNVKEWVEDCWNESYQDAPSDGSAWKSGDCSRNVFRGGAWLDTSMGLRSANRSRTDPGERRSNFIGFRIARTLD